MAMLSPGALYRLTEVLLPLLAFAQLALVVTSQVTEQLDTATSIWLQEAGWPELNYVAHRITLLGLEGVWVFFGLLLLLLVFGRRWVETVALLITTVGAQALNRLLKELFARERPAFTEVVFPADGFAFPSGHAMFSAAFYGFVAYLVWHTMDGWRRLCCTAALALLVLLVGFTRLYLGIHFLTDVIGGFLAGFAWLAAVLVAMRLVTNNRSPGLYSTGERDEQDQALDTHRAALDRP